MTKIEERLNKCTCARGDINTGSCEVCQKLYEEIKVDRDYNKHYNPELWELDDDQD